MKAYILCKREYVDMAYGILDDYKQIHILPYLRTKQNERLLKYRIEKADLILVVIDRDFNENVMLKKELDIAIEVASRDKNCFILPIIIDGAVVPEELKNYMCIYSKWNNVRRN